MNALRLEFPRKENQLDQNEEYFILKSGPKRRIRFHDYRKIYSIPGLYEEVFKSRLRCKSPDVITQLLYDTVKAEGQSTEKLRILDFGAGNGMVAEALSTGRPEITVGVDILDEAMEAALRDRAEHYAAYFVEDLNQPKKEVLTALKSFEFNTLVSVAAMGFGHIAPDCFVNAFNLIKNGGFVAFNLRDKFLTDEDKSGFRETLLWLEKEAITFLNEKTYVHRLSVSGDPIYYRALVGRKRADIKKAD